MGMGGKILLNTGAWVYRACDPDNAHEFMEAAFAAPEVDAYDADDVISLPPIPDIQEKAFELGAGAGTSTGSAASLKRGLWAAPNSSGGNPVESLDHVTPVISVLPRTHSLRQALTAQIEKEKDPLKASEALTQAFSDLRIAMANEWQLPETRTQINTLATQIILHAPNQELTAWLEFFYARWSEITERTGSTTQECAILASVILDLGRHLATTIPSSHFVSLPCIAAFKACPEKLFYLAHDLISLRFSDTRTELQDLRMRLAPVTRTFVKAAALENTAANIEKRMGTHPEWLDRALVLLTPPPVNAKQAARLIREQSRDTPYLFYLLLDHELLLSNELFASNKLLRKSRVDNFVMDRIADAFNGKHDALAEILRCDLISTDNLPEGLKLRLHDSLELSPNLVTGFFHDLTKCTTVLSRHPVRILVRHWLRDARGKDYPRRVFPLQRCRGYHEQYIKNLFVDTLIEEWQEAWNAGPQNERFVEDFAHDLNYWRTHEPDIFKSVVLALPVTFWAKSVKASREVFLKSEFVTLPGSPRQLTKTGELFFSRQQVLSMDKDTRKKEMIESDAKEALKAALLK